MSFFPALILSFIIVCSVTKFAFRATNPVALFFDFVFVGILTCLLTSC